MNPSDLVKAITKADSENYTIRLDGFDDAICGYALVAGKVRVVYDYGRCIDVLISRDSISRDAAMAQFRRLQQSIVYMGCMHPLILYNDITGADVHTVNLAGISPEAISPMVRSLK